MGAIYRNGYKYGDGNGVAQNPVLAIKSGDELYKPENGVVELPEENITVSATGADLTLSTSSGRLNTLTVYGKSEVVDGSVKSAGEGWATVDLGTLTWGYTNSRFYASINIKTYNSNELAPLICTKYPTVMYIDQNPTFGDKTTSSYAGYIYVKDMSYEGDISAFTTAMSGVLLCYQLADPTQGNAIAIKTDNGSGIDGTMATFTTGTPLRGIPDTDVRDVMQWDGSSGEVTKNCAKVRLADLTWSYNTSSTLNPFFWTYSTSFPSGNIKFRGEFSTTLYSLICSAYPTVKRKETEFIDKTLTVDGSSNNVSQIQIKNTDYTTVEDFVASLGDAELVYELATPSTEQLTTAENASIAELRTFEPQTRAQNNAGAEMTVEAYAGTANGKAVAAVADTLDSIAEAVPKKIEPSCTTTKLDNTTGWFIDATFSGLTSFDGNYIWTDGENIYYSNGTSQYVFDKASTTWSSKTWSGLTDFDGNNIWTDGVNIYYSKSSEQYVLNKSNSTWSTKTWTGLTSFNGSSVWTDGDNIYRSNGSSQYVLDKSTSTWSAKTWTGLTYFYSSPIWSDGENIYYSSGTSQYILNKETSTWSTKTWGGLTNINGSSVWTDGNDIYYSYSTTDRYVLDRSTDTWYAKKWNGVPTNFNGLYVWTDGDNIYHSLETTHKKLIPTPKIKSTRLR